MVFLVLWLLFSWIFREGKLMKLMVWRVLRSRRFEQRERGRFVALGDQLEPFLPSGDQGEVTRAMILGAVASFVEPVEDGHRQATVVTVTLGDDFPVAPYGFGQAVRRLLVQRVRKRIARQEAGRVPSGGEKGIAVAQGISRLGRHARIVARAADPAGFGQHLREQAAGKWRPPVVAAGCG